jgi:hypothetical protein
MSNQNNLAVADIIHKYLRDNNYDGLVEQCGECCCEVNDLIPCDSADVLACQPGYKIKCDCGEDCGFHITPDGV